MHCNDLHSTLSQKRKYRLNPIVSVLFQTSALMLLSTHTFAQENNELKQPTEQLAPINVISNQEAGYEYSGLVTDERKIITSNKNLITNNHDLVHNSTDLGIPEIGRYGSQGFNIRGVEGNRVAIEVDGIEQEQSNIYPAYDFHNFYNNSRVDIDTELMRTVDINKGGNPFSANSGLGGLVSYKTKNADDLLLDGHPVGVYLKNTYNGKYKQWINTAGGAFATRYVDGLMLYSHRQGHETQIERYDNGSHIGPERSLPNPYEQRQYSYLAKLGFNLNPENRIDLKLDKQHNKTNGYELTQESLPYNKIADLQERKSYTINYSYMPVNKWFNLAKIGFTHQQTLFEGNNTYGQIADNESNNVYSTKLNQINGQFNFSPITIYRSEHNFNISSLYNKHNFKTHRIRHRDNEYTEQQTPVKTNRFNLSFSDRMSFNNGISAYASLHYDRYKTDSKSELKTTHLSVLSGGAGIDFPLMRDWSLGYSYNRGFRAPNDSEMRFGGDLNIHGVVANIKLNPNLKPEYSDTHQVLLKGNGDWGNLFVTGYYTKYKDLIEFVDYNKDSEESYSQYTNTPTAKVYGVDITGKLKLAYFIPQLPEGLNLTGGLGVAHGSKGKQSLLSVQPLRALFGVEYIAPNDDWSVAFLGQYHHAKKAKDTIHLGFDPDAYEDVLMPAAHLSPSYTIFDLVGRKNFGKHASISLGVYNLFNKQYYSWDSLRTLINSGAESNSIGEKGEGIERFRGAKRYVMASVELKF